MALSAEARRLTAELDAAGAAASEDAAHGPVAANSADAAELERRLEDTRRRRAELYGEVGVRDRDLAARHAALAAYRDEFAGALGRAKIGCGARHAGPVNPFVGSSSSETP